MMDQQLSDIKNMMTPISMTGTNGHPHRGLWNNNFSFRRTSTPLSNVKPFPSVFRSHRQLLPKFNENSQENNSFLDVAESPIFFLKPKPLLPLLDDNHLNLEDNQLSPTNLTKALEKMELCDAYADNNNDYEFKIIKKNRDDKISSESSSSTHEEVKMQLNKVKITNKNACNKNKDSKVHALNIVKKNNKSGTGLSNNDKKSAKKPLKTKKSPNVVSMKISTYKGLKRSSKKMASMDNESKISYKLTKSSPNSAMKLIRCPKTPILRTAIRAEIRHQREQMQKEKEKEIEKIKKKMREEEQKQEEEERKMLRQQTVFKANPVRKYAPVPRVNKRATTEPISPKFSKRRRIDYINK